MTSRLRVALFAVLLGGLGLVSALVARREAPTLTLTPRHEGAGCARCHQATGVEDSHAALGCEACHLGDVDGGTADEAHAGLVRIPGNFPDMARTCGAAACHPSVPLRLRNNLMATMAGVVNVDRWAFGEQAEPSGLDGVDTLGHSAADTHLRNLCASCHLGREKRDFGPVGERSRGGGCNACHLRYQPMAKVDLVRFEATADAGRDALLARFTHPQLRARVPDESCFGCHSRSGRVSLNVLGLREGEPDAGPVVRTLEDGRALYAAPPDVHHERGLGCTDCHGSWEVMGDGRLARHREDQAQVACADCHTAAPLLSPPDALDEESKKTARLLGLDAGRTLRTRRSGYPLLGVQEVDGGLALTGRFSGRQHPVRPPSPACEGLHARVGCPACHDAWAPQCVSCHTRFDPQGTMYDLKEDAEAPGAWHEEPGPMFAEPGALGVRVLEDGGTRFESFIPGMVLTIDRGDGDTSFRRLFAPIAAHTTRREARACTSCHGDPLALGWGRGTIAFEAGGRAMAPLFSARFPKRPEDGLPQDAWIGVFASRGPKSTTRPDTRPLSPDEQRRVLAVGACLTCHPPNSAVFRRALADARLPAPAPRCRVLKPSLR